MTNKKLQQIGNKLGVSGKDIANIGRQRLKRKLLYPIIGAIIVVCSSGLGFLVGKGDLFSSGGYPYAIPGLALIAGAKRKKGVFILVTILLSVIGFLVAYKIGYHHYHRSILYNVFSRR